MTKETNEGGGFSTGLVVLIFLIGFGIIIFSAGFTQMPLLIFILFGSISMLAGVTMTAESRAFLGLPFILIFLFIFTSQYPAIMGQAVFGYWWPQVQLFGETFLTPLSGALGQAQNSLSDVWLMMTNPQLYYIRMTQSQQATKSVVMSGGTPKSIEYSRFDLFPSISGILDPFEPIPVRVELENQGQFESLGSNLTLATVWIDPTDNKEKTGYGSIANLECSGTTSRITGNPAYCNWTETIYPGEAKTVSFTLQEGNAWGDLYTSCTDNTPSPPVLCTSNCLTGSCTGVNISYTHSGQTVKVYSNLSYNYNVNVSIPLKMIDSSLYDKKLSAGEIVLQM